LSRPAKSHGPDSSVLIH
jgi:hypothetical protein